MRGHILTKSRRSKGFTVVEVLVAVMVLVPLFTLGMQTIIKCMELSDTARNSSLAVWGVKSQATAIENTAYNQIYTTYNNSTFTIPGINGIGKTYVDNSASDHLVISLSFSWRERNGRILGEDKNLNGALNTGEDKNSNNKLDSLVGITTQIYEM